MKRAEIKKKKYTGQFKQRTQQNTQGESLPSTSSSMDCLSDGTTKIVPQRKASTPTHDRTALSNSPDISSITNIGRANNTRNDSCLEAPKLTNAAGTGKMMQKEMSLQEQLEAKYVANLQALFKNEIVKSRCQQLDNDLTNIQQKIVENENTLRKTNDRLKNISFNKEVDTLYKLHNAQHGRILDRLDKTNCEEYLNELNTKLEQTKNQLKIKNIEPPVGGVAQLMEAVSDTLSAVEKLNKDHDVETQGILKEIKDISKTTVDSLKRGKDNLAACEDLLLNRATLEISTLLKLDGN